jgi:hypothetical protein
MTGAVSTALAFAKHGVASVPIWPPVERSGKLVCGCGKADCRSPGKHPIGRIGKDGPLIAPNGVLSATTDSGVIKHWFGDLVPAANLGVSAATLIIIDVDPRHDGLESLSALGRLGELPSTWSVKTGSGGIHLYYRRPAGLDLHLPIIAENVVRAGGSPPLGPGIDIPAYAIAPPSRHICGRHYEWDDHPSDTQLADAPGWVVERLTELPARANSTAASDPADWSRLTGSDISEYRDAHATRVAGKLLRAISLDPSFAAGLLHAWNQTYCRPPLSDRELKQIFDRIANREADRLERLNEGSAAG